MVSAPPTDIPLPRPSAGLYPSLWPADHGDTARRKYTLDGGLPRALDPSRIKVDANPALPYPQWMYTREGDELFVYGVPGSLQQVPYFAKVDARTLAVRQRIDLPWILYMGGALVHGSGDVYLIHGAELLRFPQGDLSRPQRRALPQTNGMFTQYNGLTVTHDGMLITKGWSITVRELALFGPRLKALAAGIGVAGLGAALGLGSVGIPGPLALGAGLALPLAPLMGLGLKARAAGTDWGAFFNPQDHGCLLLLDPETLETAQRLAPPERMAYGRMSMAPAGEAAELGRAPVEREYLVIPGDECIHRWTYARGRLTYDAPWRERYRTWGDGSFAGTGPAIFRQRVLYTDNTAPIGLGPGFRAFSKDLDRATPQTSIPLTEGEPGFMFWSTVVDPRRELAVTWDSGAGWIEARGLEDHKRRWRRPLFNTDCCVAQARHSHLYATDHSAYLKPSELMQSVARRPRWPKMNKDFVVLDTESGEERLRVSVGAGSPVMAMIVPGASGDVFLSRRDALVRISQEAA